MNRLLFEISYKVTPYIIIPAVVALLLIITFCALKIAFKNKNKGRALKAVSVLIAVAAAVSLLFEILAVKGQHDLFERGIAALESGEYETVEGYIENFQPMSTADRGYESFEIDGVSFFYSDYVETPGYSKTSKKGGVVTGNGQYLKIDYVYYDDLYGNVILRMEER